MSQKNVICLIHSVGGQNDMRDYEKERAKNVTYINNVSEFFEKIRAIQFSEIIFDFYFAKEIEKTETGLKILKEKSEAGVIVKVTCPRTPDETKLKESLGGYLRRKIPNIKEGLFI